MKPSTEPWVSVASVLIPNSYVTPASFICVTVDRGAAVGGLWAVVGGAGEDRGRAAVDRSAVGDAVEGGVGVDVLGAVGEGGNGDDEDGVEAVVGGGGADEDGVETAVGGTDEVCKASSCPSEGKLWWFSRTINHYCTVVDKYLIIFGLRSHRKKIRS